MEIKEDGELVDERPSSPIWVLQHISEEAFRVAGEALNNVYHGGTGFQDVGMGHRRARSEIPSTKHRRTNSFQRLKSHVQKAWGWGRDTREEDIYSFDPNIMANQKRQWYQFHSKSLDRVYQGPTSLFEHFIISGLHPDTNLEIVEDAFAKRKKWELQTKNTEMIDTKMSEHSRPSVPQLEPQIRFKYPPGKRLPMRMKDLSAFCFPAGVKTEYAAQFLNVMRQYMQSLCSDLRSHTITSVQSNNDRVSLLLKDSFIDSFPSKDRPFIKTLDCRASKMACVKLMFPQFQWQN